jgi:hypothetical protein
MDCGHTDPCRCDYHANPSEKRTDAYADAIGHLADIGLCAAAFIPELRQLWRRGGADRAAADRVHRHWTGHR